MADFKEDFEEIVNTVTGKVKEYGGLAKLQALIKAEEAKKQKYFYDLGKKYYELYKDAPASDLTDVTDKLVACDSKIAEYKEAIKTAQENGYTDVSEEDAVVEDVDAAAEEPETAAEEETEEAEAEEAKDEPADEKEE